MVDKKAQDRLDVSGLETQRRILNIFGRFHYMCSDILWGGNSSNRVDNSRSTSLADISMLFRSDIEWFSLQKEISAENGEFLDRLGIGHFEDELKTFFDTAALISQMDAVISVDTSVAHLSAALGKPTWILLSRSL